MGATACVAITPGLALASALPPSIIPTLPTGHCFTAAALTVAMPITVLMVAYTVPGLWLLSTARSG